MCQIGFAHLNKFLNGYYSIVPSSLNDPKVVAQSCSLPTSLSSQNMYRVSSSPGSTLKLQFSGTILSRFASMAEANELAILYYSFSHEGEKEKEWYFLPAEVGDEADGLAVVFAAASGVC